MATTFVFVALDVLPRTATIVALTYSSKHSQRGNMKLQHTPFGGGK
jgi:hypothetical protein